MKDTKTHLASRAIASTPLELPDGCQRLLGAHHVGPPGGLFQFTPRKWYCYHCFRSHRRKHSHRETRCPPAPGGLLGAGNEVEPGRFRIKRNLWRGRPVLVESSGRLENEAQQEIRARTGEEEGVRTRSLHRCAISATTACGRERPTALASWNLSLKIRVPETRGWRGGFQETEGGSALPLWLPCFPPRPSSEGCVCCRKGVQIKGNQLDS